jgi:hypothetical protein
MPGNSLFKIVSGGQTGVDRAGLDVAIFLGLEHGGWCPAGRRSEDGRIPRRYQLTETIARDYTVRTEQNVIDSDATLILFRQRMTGGTQLTHRLAKKHARLMLTVDIDAIDDRKDDHIGEAGQRLLAWIQDNQIGVLNVAGPRESTSPGIGKQAEMFLVQTLQMAFDEVVERQQP